MLHIFFHCCGIFIYAYFTIILSFHHCQPYFLQYNSHFSSVVGDHHHLSCSFDVIVFYVHSCMWPVVISTCLSWDDVLTSNGVCLLFCDFIFLHTWNMFANRTAPKNIKLKTLGYLCSMLICRHCIGHWGIYCCWSKLLLEMFSS